MSGVTEITARMERIDVMMRRSRTESEQALEDIEMLQQFRIAALYLISRGLADFGEGLTFTLLDGPVEVQQ